MTVQTLDTRDHLLYNVLQPRLLSYPDPTTSLRYQLGYQSLQSNQALHPICPTNQHLEQTSLSCQRSLQHFWHPKETCPTSLLVLAVTLRAIVHNHFVEP